MKTTTRIFSITVVLALLTGCALAPTSVPNATSTPLPISTSAPLPTATHTPETEPTPTTKLEIPLELQPATIVAATEFANAMTTAGTPITPEQVLQQGLVITEIPGVDGKKYEIAATQDGYPLMIKSESGEWSKIPLTNAFSLRGKELQVRAELGDGKQISALDSFGSLQLTTTTDGWLDPAEHGGKMDFKIPDYFAGISNGRVGLAQLAWGYTEMLKPWVLKLSKDEQNTRVLSNIDLILSHFFTDFKSKKFDITVAAEATSPNLYPKLFQGSDPSNPDYSYLVDQYQQAQDILNRFNRTRGVDADRLVYSDFINGINDPKLENIYSILKLLKSNNLIDVFNLQLRYVGGQNLDPSNPPSKENLAKLADAIFAETGVPVMFIEVGMNENGNASVIFENTVGACMDSSACIGVQIDSVGGGTNSESPISIYTYDKSGKPIPNIGYFAVLKGALK